MQRFWPLFSGWISAATKRTRGWWGPDDVKAACEKGSCQLWAVWEGGQERAAVVTELERAPGKMLAVISVLGGKGMRRWLPLIAEIEDWARKNGATEIQIRGRKGFERVLQRYGYGLRAVVVGKDL